MEAPRVEDDIMSRQPEIKVEKGDKFWSDRWIAVQVSQYFPEAVFLVLPVESLVVEVDVMSRQAGIKAEKGHIFLSARWIALQVLQ